MTTRDGSTPLSPDELADLIPSLATKQELNEWERENILQARAWAQVRTTISDPTHAMAALTRRQVIHLYLVCFSLARALFT